MDFNGIRRLYLPLRPKGRLSPGRKTQGQGYRPSTGLRPLIVSRVKCGGGPCRGHSVLPCAGNTIWLQYSFIKELLEDSTSACRERIAAATGPSPFKVGDNQRPERTMSGAAKIFAGFPLHDNLSTGTEDSASLLTTPDMVRSGRVLQPQLNLHLFDTIFHQTY